MNWKASGGSFLFVVTLLSSLWPVAMVLVQDFSSHAFPPQGELRAQGESDALPTGLPGAEGGLLPGVCSLIWILPTPWGDVIHALTETTR